MMNLRVLTEAETLAVEASEPYCEPTARELWSDYLYSMEQWLWSTNDGEQMDWWVALGERADQIRGRVAQGDLVALAIAERFEELSQTVPVLDLVEWLRKITADS